MRYPREHDVLDRTLEHEKTQIAARDDTYLPAARAPFVGKYRDNALDSTGPKVFTHEDEIHTSARRSLIWQVCNCARLRAHRVGFLVDGYRVQHYTLGDWITEAFAAMPFRACTEMRHYVASTTSLGPADKLGNDPARRWPV